MRHGDAGYNWLDASTISGSQEVARHAANRTDNEIPQWAKSNKFVAIVREQLMWTENSVKAALPDVAVRIGTKEYRGQVSGRENTFASVHVQDDKLRGIKFTWTMTIEYSWPAIVRSINTNTPLLV